MMRTETDDDVARVHSIHAVVLTCECDPAANGLSLIKVMSAFGIWSLSSCALPISRKVCRDTIRSGPTQEWSNGTVDGEGEGVTHVLPAYLSGEAIDYVGIEYCSILSPQGAIANGRPPSFFCSIKIGPQRLLPFLSTATLG